MERLPRTPPTAPASLLASLSAVLAGLLAGGMVVIGAVLVPFWRAAPPSEFRRWFTAHAPRIRFVMVPLGLGASVLNAASAAVQLAGHHRHGRASAAAAAATVGVVAITVAVNEPMNARFVEEPLTDDETRDLLRRCARWHHVRVGLGLVATVAASTALDDAVPDAV